MEFGMSILKSFIAALGFVFAWAVNDVLNLLAFGVYCDCTSATTCSYQSNLTYAIVITCVFSVAGPYMKNHSDDSKADMMEIYADDPSMAEDAHEV